MIVSLHVSWALAATLSGLVVDARSGDAVGEATVRLLDVSDRLVSEGSAGADGAFQLVDVPPGTWWLRVDPPADLGYAGRFYPTADSWCDATPVVVSAEDEVRDGLYVSLEADAWLTGRLVDAEGNPLEGVEIGVEALDENNTLFVGSTATDATGNFRLRGLAAPEAGEAAVVVTYAGAGVPDQLHQAVYGRDQATPVVLTWQDGVHVGEYALLPGVGLAGTVTDGEGAPVGDADVKVRSLGVTTTVRTGADGTWWADAVPKGNAQVWVQEDGWATTWYPSADRPGEPVAFDAEGQVRAGIDVVVRPEARLSVRVEGPGGVAVVGAEVEAHNDDGSVLVRSTTDSNGAAELRRLSPGTWTVEIEAERAGFVDTWITSGNGQPREFVLAEGELLEVGQVVIPSEARLTGRVLDEAGGPIHGAVVTAVDAEGLVHSFDAVTDADGVYGVGGLPEGSWLLFAQFEPRCDHQHGYVTTWYPGEANEAWARAVDVGAGGVASNLDLVLAFDDDHDGMADGWEAEQGLDPARDDSAEDPDDDGYTNLEEFLLGTDPLEGSGPLSRCGGGGCGGQALALLPLALWARGRRRRE